MGVLDLLFSLDFGLDLNGARMTGVLDLTEDLLSLELYTVVLTLGNETVELVDVNCGIFSMDSACFKYRLSAGLCSAGRTFFVILDLFQLRNCCSQSESINDILITEMDKHVISLQLNFDK